MHTEILVGKPEGTRPLGRPWHYREDNIKIDFNERGRNGKVDGIYTLQGYYAAYGCNSLLTFQDNLSDPSSRAMKSRNQEISCALKMEPTGCPETLVRNYH